jgi:hypothetical protein
VSEEAHPTGEHFLNRWSRRKHEARRPPPEQVPAAIASAPEPPPPATPLTDADMPPIASLNEHSDFSGFMSPGVSEALRRQALRKLFTLPQFSQRDPLDGEYYDCHGYLPLGDTVTYEMREEMEREARKLKQAQALLDQNTEPTQNTGRAEHPPAGQEIPATPGPEPGARRHSGHLRKRRARKRSRA